MLHKTNPIFMSNNVKRTTFISKIADYIIDNYDLTKDYLVVVFPNKRAALSLRNELAKKNDKNIWLPQMLSIQEAMSSWSGYKLIDNIDAVFELIKILSLSKELSTRKDLFGLASQMVKDFDEIDQYAVDPNHIFNHLKEVKELELWTPDLDKQIENSYINFFSSLNNYYSSLRQSLEIEKNAYYGMITKYVHNLSEEELEVVISNKKIIFAGFNAMTKTEENVIVRLVNSGNAEILWDLDKYYFEDEKQEAGQFARMFFKKHPQIKQSFLNDNFKEDKKEIKIIGVSGNTLQASALQLQLSKNEVENHSKQAEEKEAIILADENLLIPVLNSIPEKLKQLQVTMGYPYSKTILNQFIVHLFAFQNTASKNDSIYFWGFLRLINSEIFKIILSDEELKCLFKWKDLFISKSIYYINENDFDDFKTHRCLHELFSLITKKWNSSDDCLSSLKDILRTIYKMISDKDKSNFIKNQISIAGRIINKIGNLLKRHNLTIQISDIESLYKQASYETNINLKGSNEGLQIMGLLETRNIDFDTVHILSVNEGVLPQTKSNNSLIPFDLRIIYQLPIYKNKQAVYAYHFYRLLQNAKNINIYYNTLADGMGEGEKSRFIRQIIHEMPSKTNNVIINEMFYQSQDINDNAKRKIVVKKNDEILKKIENKLKGKQLDNNKISGGLSPTSISCYLSCPLKFYIKYIENIKDDTSEELIQSNVVGSIIHSTLQNLYERFSDKEIDIKIFDLIVKEHLEESYNKALIDNNFPNGLPQSGFNYLSKIMIDKLLKTFISTEREFIASNEDKTIKIVGLEEPLYHDFIVKGKDVRLMGYADRIDMIGDKIRVMDYKTGIVTNDDVKISSKVTGIDKLKEKSLQLIIYKYLYAKKAQVELTSIEPGIFALKKMSKGVFSLSNESEMFDDNNFMTTCDALFEKLYEELLDKDTAFVQTNNEKNCKICDYKDICKMI